MVYPPFISAKQPQNCLLLCRALALSMPRPSHCRLRRRARPCSTTARWGNSPNLSAPPYPLAPSTLHILAPLTLAASSLWHCRCENSALSRFVLRAGARPTPCISPRGAPSRRLVFIAAVLPFFYLALLPQLPLRHCVPAAPSKWRSRFALACEYKNSAFAPFL